MANSKHSVDPLWTIPLRKVKSNKTLQLDNLSIKFSINFDSLEWAQMNCTVHNDRDRKTQRFNGPYMHKINDKIWRAKRLPCGFSAARNKFPSSGTPYFHIEAYCTTCGNELRGICHSFEENITIHFSCMNTVGTKHKDCSIPVRGEERQRVRQKLLLHTPTDFRNMLADDLLNESGGNCPLIPNEAVLSTIRQEAKDIDSNVHIYPGDPITSLASMMREVEGIRKLSTLPFYVYYWTNNQIKLWKEANSNGLFVSIDASGGFVKKPIMYENSSESIKTPTIFLWRFLWVRTGAPVPRVCVVDCSGALLNAIALAFNGTYYIQYMEKCFRILMLDSKEEIPNCLIKRDRAHLIKNLTALKLFSKKGDNWIKKDFYVRCIAYLLQVSHVKLFADSVESIFIIANSNYADKDTECWKRTEWMFEKIESFDYVQFYGLKEDPDSTYLDKTDEKEEIDYLEDVFYQLWLDDMDNSQLEILLVKFVQNLLLLILDVMIY